MAELSLFQTPKRKRGDEEARLSPIKFSFDPSANALAEDGSNSPRSKVAHKFRGLALEGGGGAVSDDGDVEASGMMRKRQRADEAVVETPPELALDDAVAKLDSPLHRAYPSINRLKDSKSRARRRSGSPPLRLKKTPVLGEGAEDGEAEVVDPVRAALTWHEDEITMYDPKDKDDDGTGINGIGFRPTPALAEARTMKRRQQMAEYRKREESEARTRRSQRRRGGAEIAMASGPKSPARKVRFMDGDSQSIAIKTVGD